MARRSVVSLENLHDMLGEVEKVKETLGGAFDALSTLELTIRVKIEAANVRQKGQTDGSRGDSQNQ